LWYKRKKGEVRAVREENEVQGEERGAGFFFSPHHFKVYIIYCKQYYIIIIT